MKDLDKHIHRCKPMEFLDQFFKMFWVGDTMLIEKRLPILRRMHSVNLLTKEDILSQLNLFLYTDYIYDSPRMDYYLASIIFEFVNDKVCTLGMYFLLK